MVPPPQSCHRQRGRLKPTWAPKGAIRCRYRVQSRCRGQTPRPRHDGPLLTGGGLAQPKRRGGCRVDSCGHAATGEPPGIDEASEPWRVALQAGPGTLPGRAEGPQRWQARRAETVLAATVGHRHAAAAAWVGSVRRQGHSRSIGCGSAGLAQRGTDRPSALSYPTPAPGPRERSRGAVDCIAPPRTGGANPVVARSVTRRTRPSHSSAPGADRTGRCAGTRLPRDRS